MFLSSLFLSFHPASTPEFIPLHYNNNPPNISIVFSQILYLFFIFRDILAIFFRIITVFPPPGLSGAGFRRLKHPECRKHSPFHRV